MADFIMLVSSTVGTTASIVGTAVIIGVIIIGVLVGMTGGLLITTGDWRVQPLNITAKNKTKIYFVLLIFLN